MRIVNVGTLHRLLLLHFGIQCPWQPWVAEQARLASVELNCQMTTVDVTEQPEAAARYRLFYPFMTVVDETLRLPSPTPASKLVRIVTEGMPTPPLAPLNVSSAAEGEMVKSLTAENIADACALCVQENDFLACRAKAAWARQIARRIPDGLLGFAAYQEGKIVGAIEVLPANLVPYPLPLKNPEFAFITCLYSQEDALDYRGQVLEFSLEHLSGKNYREVHIIAGQQLPYPNGPVDFFANYGFEPVAELDHIVVTEGEDTLVLLHKVL
jgi:hypothetical protein